ncbi:ABC transporter substrate-binding protein [Halocella sp. SP3-1]|uniref:ABC transporter substrate-binding protein n=1 Tax=Halocella sp. SP3-1 TaxID=2382161 RepID=UPI000F763355|nr:ABC transporter substrate-binding protein [Halocella sp. SP3-1]AZO93372.1 sugar ABC transporter substrate-binding protein [Halocella sp. SP3-1]
MSKRNLIVSLLLVLVLAVSGHVLAEKPTILVSPKGTDSPYWLVVKAGAEAAAEEFGANIVWQGPQKETDIAKQVNVIENNVIKNVDAIVMAATDANALVPPLKKAQNKGIPVITIDSGVADDSVVMAHVSTDNEKAAMKAADILAILTGEEGEVGVIPFVAGAATSMARENGFKDGLEKYPGLEVVATQYSQADIATAMQVTENMLTANPNLKAIFAANLPGGVGAGRALKSRGLEDDVVLVSFDSGDTLIKQLKEGSVDALVVQRPYQMGYLGVQYAIKAINGEDIPEFVDTGSIVATRSNLNDPVVHKVLFPNE